VFDKDGRLVFHIPGKMQAVFLHRRQTKETRTARIRFANDKNKELGIVCGIAPGLSYTWVIMYS